MRSTPVIVLQAPVLERGTQLARIILGIHLLSTLFYMSGQQLVALSGLASPGFFSQSPTYFSTPSIT